MRRNNFGMSFIELLTAVAVITILAGVLVPALGIMDRNRKRSAAQDEIAQLDTALLAFYEDNGYFPMPGIEAMVEALEDNYFRFSPSRLSGSIYNDPWGKPYYYKSPADTGGNGYTLYSVSMADTSGSSSSGDSTSTSDSDSDINIGSPAGVDGKSIWNLADPSYDIMVKAMLDLIRNTDAGYELAAKINISNVPIEWGDLDGILAQYDPVTHTITLDTSVSDMSVEAAAAILAHEATHLADHLASGDMDYDSVDDEYDAYYNEAMVWKQIKGTKTDPTLDAALLTVERGEESAREWIRANYPWLPEKDQWGDSYVVAKKY